MDFNFKKPLHILALFFLSLSFLIIVVMPVFSFFGFFGTAETENLEQINQLSPSFRLMFEIITLLIQFALVIFFMIFVPLIWYLLVNRYDLKKIFKSLMLKKKNLDKLLVFAGIAAVLMFLVIFIMESVLIEAGFEVEDFGNAQDIANIFSPVTMFILVVFQPIPEEIFFRGFLLDKANSLWGKHFAVLFTAVLFGVAQLSYQKFIPGLLIIFIGLILGYLVLKTRNLYSAIFAHILFNVTSFLWLMLG
jgi:membrane protease YdiL (CAAX protease family)